MIVLLYNIRSMHNVGSIFRTADAAGVKKIYLCGITPKPIDEFGRSRQQLTKVSLGAEKYIDWEKVTSASRLIDKLKKDGYKIISVEQNKQSIPFYKYKSKKVSLDKIALVLGNEVKGLPLSILNKSDEILEIPMSGTKESLNVSVSFGVIAYYFALLYNEFE